MSIHITYTYRKMKISQNQKFTILPISHWRDLNPRPADYKSGFVHCRNRVKRLPENPYFPDNVILQL